MLRSQVVFLAPFSKFTLWRELLSRARVCERLRSPKLIPRNRFRQPMSFNPANIPFLTLQVFLLSIPQVFILLALQVFLRLIFQVFVLLQLQVTLQIFLFLNPSSILSFNPKYFCFYPFKYSFFYSF